MRRLLLPLALLLLIIAVIPAISQTSYNWLLKVPGSGHGCSLVANPLNPNIILGSPNTSVVWISRDRGNNWVQLGNVGGSGGIAAIAVNPLDTNQIIVAQRSSPNRVMKTTNNGSTWTQTWANGSFASFGVPFEHKIQYPQLVYIMGGNRFEKSTDFGSTWTLVTTTVGFNAWCDAEISPVDEKVVLVGDNGSGMWKTTDGGLTWALKSSNSGEIPMIAWSISDPNIIYATRWGGGNGVIKSTNYGETWTQLPQVTGSMWSLAVGPANPNYVVACNYGTSMYITRNGGLQWSLTNTGLSGSGNGALVVDTFKVFALNGGIFKLNVPENVSTRNVQTTFSVDLNYGVDYYNDTPLSNPSSIWIKGELPALGALSGNWTFSDTSGGSLIRLYDDGTNGDPTANDNIWTRIVQIPSGTMLGQFKYKYGAVYPGVDASNGGVQYLNNESGTIDYHTANFSDTDTIVVFPTDRWKTRGTVFSSSTTFAVDLRGGADSHTGVAISSLVTSVWVKGTLPLLGSMAGNWTFADTLNTMIRLYDDGTHGDLIAGDRVWTNAMTFPAYTRVGNFSYKYAAVYPGVENNNGGFEYLNNESGPSAFHSTILAESTLTTMLNDSWLTRASAVFYASPDSLALTIANNNIAFRTLALANNAEEGSQPFTFSIRAEDPAFENTLSFGSHTQTFSGAGRDRGNIYYASRSSLLKNIRTYLEIGSATNLAFFVYEGTSRTGSYTRVFLRTVPNSIGNGWHESGSFELSIRQGKYYYVGVAWQGSVVYGKDLTYPGPAPTEFGSWLTGQALLVAGYPPASIINGSSFGDTSGAYTQGITVNTSAYIDLSVEQGVLNPGESREILVSFNAIGLNLGHYYPILKIQTNISGNTLIPYPCHVEVTQPTSVGIPAETPKEFALRQNYPNPFNPSTSIRFELPVASSYSLRVFNLLGQQIAELDHGTREAGYYEARWNGIDDHGRVVATGLYFYELSVVNKDGVQIFQQRRKMVLLK